MCSYSIFIFSVMFNTSKFRFLKKFPDFSLLLNFFCLLIYQFWILRFVYFLLIVDRFSCFFFFHSKRFLFVFHHFGIVILFSFFFFFHKRRFSFSYLLGIVHSITHKGSSKHISHSCFDFFIVTNKGQSKTDIILTNLTRETKLNIKTERSLKWTC